MRIVIFSHDEATAGFLIQPMNDRELGPLEMSREERESWRMPALALLERPIWSLPRRAALAALSTYLVLSIVLLAVKAVQIAVQH